MPLPSGTRAPFAGASEAARLPRSGTDSTVLASYLQRLGLSDPGEPSLASLFALHRAHVEQVPYEVIDIHLGRPSTVDPDDAVRRVLAGRGGYCVQLNSAFSVLLSMLGYDVTWHGAGVQGAASSPAADASFAPHLALSVELDGQHWLVDVGLGDGLLEPLPLRTGDYQQGPFTFRIVPSEVEAGGWRFEHDPRGSIAAIDLRAAPTGQDVFEKWHPYLCTSADSRLVRALTVMRRDQDSTDSLTGCMLRHFDASGKTVREVGTADEWFQVLAEVFNLRLSDLDADERAALWAKVRGTHEAWLIAKAKRAS